MTSNRSMSCCMHAQAATAASLPVCLLNVVLQPARTDTRPFSAPAVSMLRQSASMIEAIRKFAPCAKHRISLVCFTTWQRFKHVS
jgi:hypothetical protein